MGFQMCCKMPDGRQEVEKLTDQLQAPIKCREGLCQHKLTVIPCAISGNSAFVLPSKHSSVG